METQTTTPKKTRKRMRSSDLHKQPLVRFQVEVLSRNLPRYEKAMAMAGLPTKRALVDYALAVLEWMIEETKLGRTVDCWRKDVGFVELCTPALASVRAIAKVEQAEQPAQWSHWEI